jgi:hypothetical protein
LYLHFQARLLSAQLKHLVGVPLLGRPLALPAITDLQQML